MASVEPKSRSSCSIILVSICCVCTTLSSSSRMLNREFDDVPFVEDPLFFYYHRALYPRDCSEVLGQCTVSNKSGVYVIQPIGCLEPFEVFCNNDNHQSGWTLIHRRLDGSINFNRPWNDFKNGFGYISKEFWLGNDKISFLTNQAVYELQIDLVLSDGSSLYANYGKFRITDEWGNYTLVEAEKYSGNGDDVISYCPDTMIYGNCSFTFTCDDPNGISGFGRTCSEAETCQCRDGFLLHDNKCVRPEECGCYVPEEEIVVSDGDWHINQQCTSNVTCIDGELLHNFSYSCNSNAKCNGVNGTRKCYCNPGYDGDGESCTAVFRDCSDAYNAGHVEDGLYTITPTGWTDGAFQVFCNMTIDGGGYTVFQRRTNGECNFNRDWNSYRDGFGNLKGEFWLGNEKLYYLTNQAECELRVDIVPSTSTPKYATYNTVKIDSEHTHYRIVEIEDYSGNAGNGLSEARGFSFSSFDSDNDGLPVNCVDVHQGAWWYGGDYDFFYGCAYCDLAPSGAYCQRCTVSNLNGDFNGAIGQGVWWHFSSNCHLIYTEMKLRRIQ